MKKKILSVLITILSFCTLMSTMTACNDNDSNNSDLTYAATVMDKAIIEIDNLNALMFQYANEEAANLSMNEGNGATLLKNTTNTQKFSLYNTNTDTPDVFITDESPKNAIAKQLNAKYPFEVVDYLLKNAVDGKYYKKKYEINKTFYGQATHIIDDRINQYFNMLNIKPTFAINVQKEDNGISFKVDWDWRDPALAQEAPAYNSVICTNGKIEYDNNNGIVKKIYMNWFFEESDGDFMACLLDLEENVFYYMGGYRSGKYLPQEETIVNQFNIGVDFAENFINQDYEFASVVKANIVDNLEDFNYIGYSYWDSDLSNTTNIIDGSDVTKEEYVALVNEVYSKVSTFKMRGKEGYLSLSNATEIDYMNHAAIYGYNRTVTTITDDGINYLYTDKKDMHKILDGLTKSDVVKGNTDAVDLVNKAMLEFEKQEDNYIGDLGYHFGSGIEYAIRYGNGYSYDGWCHYCDSYKRIIKNDKVVISFNFAQNKVSNVVIDEDFSDVEDDIPVVEPEPLTLTYEYDESLGGYKVVGYTGYPEQNQTLEIPATYQNMPVKAIDKGAFSSCGFLTNIVIPDSVVSVGDYAFNGCSSLLSITIGNGVTAIGSRVFYGCFCLTIYCESTSKPSVWGNEWNHVGTEGDTAPVVWDCVNNNIAEDGNIYVVVNDLRYVLKDDEATITYQRKNIETANIPEEILVEGNRFVVKSIYGSAFANCSNLTSVVIGDSVTSIGEYAFFNCMELTSIEIPDSVTSIGERAFHNCSALTSIEIPNSVISIGEGTFSNCRSLIYIKTGNGITSLDCFDVSICETIHLGSNITDIGDVRFSKCVSITVDSNNAKYKAIDGNLYSKDGKTLIQYAGGKIETVFTIPNSVTSIEEYAFNGCRLLTSIEIPNSITRISDRAFSGCIALTNIEIPNSVTSIGDNAFNNCRSLQYNIEGDLKYLGNSINKYIYLVGTTSTSITNVSINSNCKFIGERAFNSCRLLEEIEIPNGVTSIGERAFLNCRELTSVEMPNSVRSISIQAFSGCSSLEEIVIPSSVTSIGELVFSRCASLKSVYYQGTAIDWEKTTNGADESSLMNATLYYYSETQPSIAGNYWCYDTDGVTPIVWVYTTPEE